MRVLKVQAEDRVRTPVLTCSCQNNIYFSYRLKNTVPLIFHCIVLNVVILFLGAGGVLDQRLT